MTVSKNEVSLNRPLFMFCWVARFLMGHRLVPGVGDACSIELTNIYNNNKESIFQ